MRAREWGCGFWFRVSELALGALTEGETVANSRRNLTPSPKP
jgi:hypothetical protein